MDFDELAVYRKLPWDKTGVHWNETADELIADAAMNQHEENLSIEIEQENPDTTSADDIETTEQNKSLLKARGKTI